MLNQTCPDVKTIKIIIKLKIFIVSIFLFRIIIIKYVRTIGKVNRMPKLKKQSKNLIQLYFHS